jgi:hypothetical protein
LNDEPEGGSEATRRKGLLSWSILDVQKQQVGKWETCFWFSTFPRRAGAVGRWESRSDFQGLWETQGNLGLVFLVFHAPVISTVLPGFI